MANAQPREQRVLRVAEYAHDFVACVARILVERGAAIGTLEFDKDDDLLMDFVAFASNLRMVRI